LDAGKTIRIEPDGYERIKLPSDPPGRRHHAIIFDNIPPCEKLIPKSKIPNFFTWTPTGHGCVSKWNIVRNPFHAHGAEHVALLIPRSLWIWFIPEWIMSQEVKMSLFYLEAQVPPKDTAVPASNRV